MICVGVDWFLGSLVLFENHRKYHPAIEDYGGRGIYTNQEEVLWKKKNLFLCKTLDPNHLGSEYESKFYVVVYEMHN